MSLVRVLCSAALVPVLLLLAGCEVSYEERLNISENGAGSLTVIMRRSERQFTDLAAGAMRFDTLFSKENMQKNKPDDITLQYEEIRPDLQSTDPQRALVTIIAAYGFTDVQKFCAWAATTNLPFNQLSVQMGEKSLTYSRRFGPFSADDVKSLANHNVVAVFRVTAPGRATSQDGRVEGETTIWEITPDKVGADGTIKLSAEYNWSTPAWVFVLIVLCLIALGVVIAKGWRAKSEPPPQTPATPTSGGHN